MIYDCSVTFSIKGKKKEQNQVWSTQRPQVQSFLRGHSGQYLLSVRPLHPYFGSVLLSLLMSLSSGLFGTCKMTTRGLCPSSGVTACLPSCCSEGQTAEPPHLPLARHCPKMPLGLLEWKQSKRIPDKKQIGSDIWSTAFCYSSGILSPNEILLQIWNR